MIQCTNVSIYQCGNAESPESMRCELVIKVISRSIKFSDQIQLLCDLCEILANLAVKSFRRLVNISIELTVSIYSFPNRFNLFEIFTLKSFRRYVNRDLRAVAVTF